MINPIGIKRTPIGLTQKGDLITLTNHTSLVKIISMKMVWIYVMLGSMSVFIGSLVPSLFRFDSGGIDWLVMSLWCITGISILTSILGFCRASKLGREEDEIKRHDREIH